MRAFVIDRIGDRGHLTEVPDATAAAGEVLIQVNAVGLVASDWRVRGGSRQGRQDHVFPAVMGFDFAGTIAAASSDGATWTVGERVYGIAHKPFIGAGALAELVAMPATGPIARTPSYLSDAEAAALVSGWFTARATLDVAPAQAGETVLLVGASGGVGSVLTQCLAHRRAEVVAVSRAANDAYVRSLGARDVIRYDECDAVQAARDLHPQGYDMLIDLISEPPRFDELATAVRPDGLAVSAVRAADTGRMAASGLRVANVAASPNGALLAELEQAWRADGFVLPPIEILPFAATADGIERLEHGHVRGKLVVAVP